MMNKKKASPNGTTSLSTTGKKKIREAIENVKE